MVHISSGGTMCPSNTSCRCPAGARRKGFVELPEALISALAPLAVLPMDCPVVGCSRQSACHLGFLLLAWPPLQPALYLMNSQQAVH